MTILRIALLQLVANGTDQDANLRSGQILMTYAKVHTCDFHTMELACTPGEDFSVCQLETSVGTVQVGAMICYDREAPESARVLRL